MPLPELFKYDVRVRERLQRRRLLSEEEVEQHLAGLSDVSANATEIELKQPALQTEAERAENSVIVRPAPPRPLSIAAPILLDDEDEEEEEEVKRVAPPKASASGVPPAAAAAAAGTLVAAVDDDDDEDEDEDEEDDDEDDEDDEDKDEEDDAEDKDDDEPTKPGTEEG
jgi:hypothetical protein